MQAALLVASSSRETGDAEEEKARVFFSPSVFLFHFHVLVTRQSAACIGRESRRARELILNQHQEDRRKCTCERDGSEEGEGSPVSLRYILGCKRHSVCISQKMRVRTRSRMHTKGYLRTRQKWIYMMNSEDRIEVVARTAAMRDDDRRTIHCSTCSSTGENRSCHHRAIVSTRFIGVETSNETRLFVIDWLIYIGKCQGKDTRSISRPERTRRTLKRNWTWARRVRRWNQS